MSATAKLLVWSFFLLIVDQTLVILAFKFGLPIRPTYVYFVIAFGLLTLSLMIERSLQPLASARTFFLPFLVLVALVAIMYRGENVGSDFGQLILLGDETPSNMSYALWPALNLVACAALYLLTGREEFRRTIIIAAFAALVLQVLTMETDMWWAASFGDANGRAGGLARNANVAALLVVVLASLTIGTRLAPYAVIIATAGVLLSQSKAGAIVDLILVSCFFLEAKRKAIDGLSFAFTVAVVLMLAGTAYFSPVLNPSPEKIAEAASVSVQPRFSNLPVAELDRPVTLQERIEARALIGGSGELRRLAVSFFLDRVKEHPFGFGTGFTNKFVTGPHNSFLKLAVDNGVLAAALLFLMLLATLWRAIELRSPLLASVALIAGVAANLYHTLLVDPIILPALAIAMGFLNSGAGRSAS